MIYQCLSIFFVLDGFWIFLVFAHPNLLYHYDLFFGDRDHLFQGSNRICNLGFGFMFTCPVLSTVYGLGSFSFSCFSRFTAVRFLDLTFVYRLTLNGWLVSWCGQTLHVNMKTRQRRLHNYDV